MFISPPQSVSRRASACAHVPFASCFRFRQFRDPFSAVLRTFERRVGHVAHCLLPTRLRHHHHTVKPNLLPNRMKIFSLTYPSFCLNRRGASRASGRHERAVDTNAEYSKAWHKFMRSVAARCGSAAWDSSSKPTREKSSKQKSKEYITCKMYQGFTTSDHANLAQRKTKEHLYPDGSGKRALHSARGSDNSGPVQLPAS